MFCKPPCPDEHDLSTIPDDSGDRSARSVRKRPGATTHSGD